MLNNGYESVCGGPTGPIYAKLIGTPVLSGCPVCRSPVRYRVQCLGKPAGMKCGHCGYDDETAQWPSSDG